jgi:hypothetical protein
MSSSPEEQTPYNEQRPEEQTPYNELLSRRTNTIQWAAVQKNKHHTMSSCPEEQTAYNEQRPEEQTPYN